MTDRFDQTLAGAFARASEDAARALGAVDPSADVAARSYRRRRLQRQGSLLGVVVLGGAVTGAAWWGSSAGSSDGGGQPRATTTVVTVTTTEPDGGHSTTVPSSTIPSVLPGEIETTTSAAPPTQPAPTAPPATAVPTRPPVSMVPGPTMTDPPQSCTDTHTSGVCALGSGTAPAPPR